ncbi:MerR family transcriptional regulator [Actinoplanes sp. ATCC 53533]|uniref:MerR family transcriptional regulator n=1 Tax=Actinoplanes sp. ATCC 53533 TaxID=1288362 RepID=UPI000F772FE4|nr:MerR family transcriptional regulator [Actinoplanes sp. ATCC 53533]RSM47492.1 MerR family transcriptional regulator [Actinoplanes sp. ATCC 53533]
MRISDLSRQAGTPVGTVKFYLREGLLPPGRPTGRNQAAYDRRHLSRLRLIRALTAVARLSLSSVRALLTAIDDERLPLPELFRAVEHAVTTYEPQPALAAHHESAGADADELIDRMGWTVSRDAPSRQQLVEVLSTLRHLGSTCEVDFFLAYARTADLHVPAELDLVAPDGASAERAAASVRSILFEVMMTAMRRMAYEHHARDRFGG